MKSFKTKSLTPGITDKELENGHAGAKRQINNNINITIYGNVAFCSLLQWRARKRVVSV